jgi:hypothetical protein
MTADMVAAVRAVVAQAPPLTDDQRRRIRAILLPALPADHVLVLTEDDDAPGDRPGRRSTNSPGHVTRGGRRDGSA